MAWRFISAVAAVAIGALASQTAHAAAAPKGGLNLESLTFDPATADNFKVWQRVFERVRDGEMPPAKKRRPDATATKQFIASLSQPLIEADREDIAENGRVRSRRLTRVEYEHTLHDLLGIDLPLKELLPEDPATHGFQTVASGQQLSHFQLARYLDVADLALKEAFKRALLGDQNYRGFFSLGNQRWGEASSCFQSTENTLPG